MTHQGPVSDDVAPVESVDRALRIIMLIRDRGSLSIKEAASHLCVAPSTAHRLLTTLTYRGFAVQDYARRYLPGPELSQGSSLDITLDRLREAASDYLPILQRESGETAQVMALVGQNIRFLEGAEPMTMLRVAARRGTEMPAFVSAGGKAILARMSNPEIEMLFPGELPAWSHRRFTTLSSLKRAMTRIRRDGYALSNEETEQGVAGVGVAVVDGAGKPLGAVTIAMPVSRYNRDDLEGYVAALKHAADGIQRELAP